MAAAVALPGALLAGCAGTGADGETAAPLPTRQAEFTSCPSVALASPPEGFRLARSELAALADNHMGRVLTYRSGEGQVIQVYSGPDLYDELEDLDTTAEAVTAGGRRFTLYSTLLAPGLQIAVLDTERLEGEGFEEPCEDAGVQSLRLSRGAMVDVLGDLQVEVGGFDGPAVD